VTPVCSLDELEDGRPHRVEVDGVPLALVRCGDRVFAVNDICSHAHISLSGGAVWCDELEIECPKHGSTFSLLTGEPATLPATQPVDVYAVEIIDGVVHVDIRSRQGAR
jgi:3-phenylpropionate/trans-cinnamate dioxygenase ferredoxin component